MNFVLKAALDHLEEGVVVTNAGNGTTGSTICYANRAFVHLTGYTLEELLGQSPHLLHGPKTDTEVAERLNAHFEAGNKARGESINYGKDGSEFTMQWQVFPVVQADEKIAHTIGIHRDVSRIRRLEEDLLQAQKMDAVGRLARGIAHDFNNLLAVILSFSELLLENPDSQKSLTAFVTEIHKAAKRAAGLTSELMAFSRRESPDPELLELGDVLSQMSRIIRRIIPENIEVEAHLPEEPIYVRINRAALEQALVHLTTNARDALPAGGRITIDLTSLSGDETTDVLPEYSTPGSYAVISYADNGTGMTEETASRVFEPFFTTKPIGKGTGLGLSTTYATVKNSNGHIKVESEVDKGTRVTISLPRESVMEESNESVETPVRPLIARQVQILVVEDDENMRDCITGVLSIYNFEVFNAGSAEEALENFEPRAGDIHVLLTDLILPKMNGSDLARHFLEKNPEIKVLYMTGYDDETRRLDTLPGKAALLRKPFSLNQVLTTVQTALDGR